VNKFSNIFGQIIQIIEPHKTPGSCRGRVNFSTRIYQQYWKRELKKVQKDQARSILPLHRNEIKALPVERLFRLNCALRCFTLQKDQGPGSPTLDLGKILL